ncbi:unnamed protein product, partial [marine sediment metagenome]
SVERPGLTVVTVRQFLDYVFLDDDGVFVDNSVEADTAGGTAFLGIGEVTNDFLYMGKETQFNQVDQSNDVDGAYTLLVYTYWDGSSWSVLATAGQDDYTADGVLTFTAPGDWAKTTVNGVNAYWIRAQETSAVTTPVTLFSVGRTFTAALVENTDFKVAPGAADGVTTTKDGAIARIASGGQLEPGEEIKTSFTYVTFTSQTFGIAEQSIIEGSARFVNNPQSGRGTHWEMTFPRCQLNNNGAMDLDDTDFQTIP